ncbi:MAG: hypothetical protein V5B33_00015 [Candidatus Accumulibacter sp. UW20]|jgi:hypothetical protein
MSIRAGFPTAVIKKSAVRRNFTGGEEAFRTAYPYASEDQQLFGIGSMSTGEMEEIIDELTAGGLRLSSCFAVGGGGAIHPCPDIVFEQVAGGMFPRWEARATVDEPEVMAAEGEKLVRWMMRQGWTFHVPEVPSIAGGPAIGQ